MKCRIGSVNKTDKSQRKQHSFTFTHCMDNENIIIIKKNNATMAWLDEMKWKRSTRMPLRCTAKWNATDKCEKISFSCVIHLVFIFSSSSSFLPLLILFTHYQSFFLCSFHCTLFFFCVCFGRLFLFRFPFLVHSLQQFSNVYISLSLSLAVSFALVQSSFVVNRSI